MSKYWRPQCSEYLREPTMLAAELRGKNVSRIVSDALREMVGAELEVALSENDNIDAETREIVITWLKKFRRIK